MAVNNEILDRLVRHQIYLQRYASGTVARMIRILNEADLDVVAQIERRSATVESGNLTSQRLDNLLDAIRVINRDAHILMGRELRKELRDLATYEADFNRRVIDGASPVRLDVTTPSADMLRAVVDARPFQGRYLREWLTGLEQSSAARVRDAVRLGMVEGETVGQMVRRIRGTRAAQYKDGLMEISRRGAETMIRTAVNHTANAAKQALYEANADILKGLRWSATLDGRTSDVCRARDGKMFPLDSGPRPPAHPNCRSVMVPVTKSYRDLGVDLDDAPEGTRASMDGQVPASETYETWLRKQPAGFQDDVLGPSRGRLYRQGGMTLDRFVDGRGRRYTLDELRRVDAAAFERANI